jgi:hypothetical protein
MTSRTRQSRVSDGLEIDEVVGETELKEPELVLAR